jgi:hypothetical protein
MSFLEVHPKANDDRFTERKARLGTVPGNELVDAATIFALRTQRGKTPNHRRLSLLQIRKTELGFRTNGFSACS